MVGSALCDVTVHLFLLSFLSIRVWEREKCLTASEVSHEGFIFVSTHSIPCYREDGIAMGKIVYRDVENQRGGCCLLCSKVLFRIPYPIGKKNLELGDQRIRLTMSGAVGTGGLCEVCTEGLWGWRDVLQYAWCPWLGRFAKVLKYSSVCLAQTGWKILQGQDLAAFLLDLCTQTDSETHT